MIRCFPTRAGNGFVRRWILLAATLSGLTLSIQCLLIRDARAQDPAEAIKQETAQRLEVFALKQISAESALDILGTLMTDAAGMRMVTSEAVGDPPGNRGSRLIVYGTEEQLASVRKMLAKLDQRREDETTIKVFHLMYSQATETAEVLSRLAADVNVAVDARTNSLIVSADSNDSLKKFELLAELLDSKQQPNQTQATYTMHLFWLTEAGDDDALSKSSAKPDVRITEAVNELRSQGFTNVVQVGHAQIVVRSGGLFRVKSTQPLGQLAWEGQVSETSRQVLELKLDIAVQHESGEKTSLTTEVDTEVGHNVVIGIAGATGPQRRNAFVIRVES